MNPDIIAALSAFGGAMSTTTTENDNAYVFLDGKGQHMATIYPKPNAVKLFEQLALSVKCTFQKKDPEYKADDVEFDVVMPKA